MSEGSNIDLDIDNIGRKNSRNFKIKLQESFSSSNKSNNDYEMTKSGSNPMATSKISSLKDVSHNTPPNLLYKSDFSEIKNKISSNSLVRKFSDQRLEPVQIDSNTNTEIKSKSPKKARFSMIRMVEKSKYNKYFNSPVKYAKKIKEESDNTSRERRDVYGNLICKKNRRKVRVTFADEIEEEKPLASVIDIESYKKYNYIFGMPKVDTINKNITTNCQCCIVF